MHTTAARAYLNTDVTTAVGSQLILRLYDKAISCLSLGEEAIESGEMEVKSRHLTRVLDIIHELTVSINLDYEPIATNLFSLYGYMSQRVLDGCLRNNRAALHEVSTMFKDLRSSWEVAVRKNPGPEDVKARPMGAAVQESQEAGAA
jgi:flagellar protein FliS